ncbi:MAG TPA: tRNA (adenosine(37)-N6)-threonylcarbamoyltransferase complex transferase subunit TsaD [Firmicutes bacterium]|nr:tRNA (adenosine(37)-N6)-threonylcarbamoyltransferase complex transferase subunit TsaD [Candidatus Fermentithermobacillaceae bacterium]
MIVLGIDTSCDDTSCAVVKDGRQALSNIVSSQTSLHSKYGGVVPEIASRRHLEVLIPVSHEALAQAGVTIKDIDAVAVTNGPGLLGSLLVGVCYAKSLAYAAGIPLIDVHHLAGHIYANFLGEKVPEFPLLNLVVSGGHSELIFMESHGRFSVIAETRDDAAGEVFDKVAREIGLGFPGGPYLDKLAETGDPHSIPFPLPKIRGSKYDYSFSGIKTRALLEFESGGKAERLKPDLAASFRKAVVDQLLHAVEELLINTGARSFAISGGVAANTLLRRESRKLAEELNIPLFAPPKALCTDNGAMIAAAGYYKYKVTDCCSPEGPWLNPLAGLEMQSWGEDMQ